jgi:hypothetical protein
LEHEARVVHGEEEESATEERKAIMTSIRSLTLLFERGGR